MDVLLVHGLGRTPLSLLGLSRDLRRAGQRTELAGYLGALEPYHAIVARIRRRLVGMANRQRPYAAIGHSLGGLVLRAALGDWPSELPTPRCLVTLGTPGTSPRLAQRFQRWRLYRWVNGECGQLLAQSEFFAGLPPTAVPLTAVAGTKSWPAAVSLFGPEPNDGIVAVEETRSSAGSPVITRPTSHTFMMNDRGVRTIVREALARADDAGRQHG
jgi:hypothetical protein